MRRPPMPTRRGERGLTLVEMTISMAIASVALFTASLIMHSATGAVGVAETRSGLQEIGRRILDDVLDDVRRSGLTTSPATGNSLPAIFERPLQADGTSTRGNLVATMDYNDVGLVSEVLAWQGAGDRIARNRGRISNEFAFQVPRDLDGDGLPLDANGDLEWGPEEFSYHLVADGSGTPWLMREGMVAGVQTEWQRVGPWVSNITFDVVFNDRTLRFGEVAVVVYLQRRNSRGQWIQAAIEGSVVLRNTKEL